MFDMFADRARQVVLLAQEEATVALKHRHIGTEHLLLGLLAQGDGMAAEALESLSITLDAARQQVAELVAAEDDFPSGSIPFTQRAKTMLQLSQEEARSLGHSEVDTAHLLLALLREGTGTGAQVPVKLGIELDQVRLQVLQLLLPGILNSSAAGAAVAASSQDVATITTQLQGIQDALTELSTRLATIERHLNVN